MLMNVIPGVPGQDYPILSSIPPTSFSCAGRVPGGYYADPAAECQVFHVCSQPRGFHSFLCPNGTIFHQAYLTCDFWYNSDCSKAESLYGINKESQAERESSAEPTHMYGRQAKDLELEEISITTTGRPRQERRVHARHAAKYSWATKP